MCGRSSAGGWARSSLSLLVDGALLRRPLLAEPPLGAHGTEVTLQFGQLHRRWVVCAKWRLALQERDLHAGDEIAAELEVADTDAAVRRAFLAADLSDEPVGYDGRLAFREHACLRGAHAGD